MPTLAQLVKQETGLDPVYKKPITEGVTPPKQIEAPSTTGRKSHLNSKGQRVYEGDEGYDPTAPGASKFYEGGTKVNSFDSGASGSGGSSANTATDTMKKDRYQKQIDDANNRAAKAEAEKTAAYTANQRLLDEQKQQYAQLDQRFGDISQQIRGIIAGVEKETGKRVVIDEEFLQSVAKLQGTFGDRPDQFERFVGDLAENNSRTNQTPLVPSTREEATQEGGAVDGQVSEAGLTVADAVKRFDPSNPDELIRAVMEDPSSTSEDILLASLAGTQLAQSGAAYERMMEYLERSAERTRQYQKEYTDMMSAQRSELTALLEGQQDIANRKYAAMEEEIRAQKAETMADLTDKRSRLEGFMKAKLKDQGLLNSTFGMNQLATSITKYDAMMVSKENEYDRNIQQLDILRMETMFNLSSQLVKINHEYDQKIFSYNEQADEKVDQTGLEALKNTNEYEAGQLTMAGDFARSILGNRAGREKAAREALEAARKELKEQAEWFTEQSGYIYTVKDDEIVVMTDAEGNPLMNWEMTKEVNKNLWEREKFNATLDFNREKEAYDQWESSAKISIDSMYKQGLLSNMEHDNALADLSEQRKMNEYQWDLSDDYAKQGIPRWQQSDLFSRTDRHNNPTATAWPSANGIKALTDIGLEEGVDFWKGDKFGGGVTMAFRNIEVGLAATTALLGYGQIAGWYGKPGYTGRNTVIGTISRILQEESGTQKTLPQNISSQKLQDVFNALPEWRKQEVTMAIYGVENNGGISQGAFKAMTPSGGTETDLPVWEDLTLNRLGSRYSATKEDMEGLKSLWAQEKAGGMSMADFQNWVKEKVRLGGSGGSGGSLTSTVTAAEPEKDSAAAFLGF